MSILELKKVYNKTLARYYKAEEYLNKATEEQFNKWCLEFQKIIMQLSQMMKDYKHLTGEEMSKEETLEGFREVS